ncbi:hypothetical protein BSZ39_12535, partial [Bowdeniella nasicola]
LTVLRWHAHHPFSIDLQIETVLDSSKPTADPDTLRRAGFDLTVKAKRPALGMEQKAEARRLFDGGSTRRELMEMHGVSESTISRALRR